MEVQFLTASSMKKIAVWVAALCIPIEVYLRFRDACCPHHQGEEYLCIVGKLYQTLRRNNNTQDSHVNVMIYYTVPHQHGRIFWHRL